MVRKFLIILLIPVYFFPIVLHAQYFQFSQYFDSPLNLNPAMTGLFNGKARSVINYKNQFGVDAPFHTSSMSLDLKIPSLKNTFGIGAVGYFDNAGLSQFNTNKFFLSMGYKMVLNTDQSTNIALGLQGGLIQKSINFSTATFNSQYNGISFEPGLSNGENFKDDKISYIDAALGVLWYSLITENLNTFAGISVFQLNTSKKTWITGSIGGNTFKKVILHAGLNQHIKNLIIQPKILIINSRELQELTLGGLIGYNLKPNNDVTLNIGIWHKNILANKSNIITTVLRIDIKTLSIGLSYDAHVSGLNTSFNALNGPEISLIYIYDPVRDGKEKVEKQELKKNELPRF